MATSIQLSPEIEQRLDFLASQTGRAKDFYVRELIERAVEDMEDYYLAADVLERIREGTEEVYSAEEVSRSLGLDAGDGVGLTVSDYFASAPHVLG